MIKVLSLKRLALLGLSASIPLVGTAATDLAGADLTVTSLDPDGYVNTGAAATLTVDIDSDVSYSGSISGDISLVKKGVGVLTLAAASPYTGTTRVEGGVLEAPNAYIGNVVNNTGGGRITLGDGGKLRLTTSCAVTQRQLAVDAGKVGYFETPNNVLVYVSVSNLLFEGATLVKCGGGQLGLYNGGRFNDRNMTGSTLRCAEGTIFPAADVFGNASGPSTLTLEILQGATQNFNGARGPLPQNCILRGGTITTKQRSQEYKRFERFAFMKDYDLGVTFTVYPGEGNAVTSTIFAVDGCHLVQKANVDTVFDVQAGAVLRVEARLNIAYTRERDNIRQGFYKRGPGTLFLAQPVNVNDPLRVEAGKVVFARTAYLSSSCTLVVSPGATVELEDGTILASPMTIGSGDGAVTLSVPSGAAAAYCNPGTSAAPDGTRSIVKSGGGTLAWTGGEAGLTDLRVGEGTLALRASNSLSRASIWVDPSDATTVTRDDSDGTDRVVRLANKGSAGGAFVQGKNKNGLDCPCPPYEASGINGLATLGFDGDSGLVTSALDTYWQTDRHLIVFCVFTRHRFESSTPYGPWNGPFSFSTSKIGGDDAGYEYGFHLEEYPYEYGSNHALNIRGSSGHVNRRWDDVNLAQDEPYIFVSVQRPRGAWHGVECAADDSSNLPRFTNGMDNASIASPLLIDRISLGGRLSAGCIQRYGKFANGNRMWFGQIGEFIAITDDATQEDIDAILAYLRKKWLNKGSGSATPPACLTGDLPSVPSFSSVHLAVAGNAVLEHSATEQTIGALSLESGAKIVHTPPTAGAALFNVTGAASLAGSLAYEGHPCPEDSARLFSYGTLSLSSPVWTFSGDNVKGGLHAYDAQPAHAYYLSAQTGLTVIFR